MMRHIQKLSWIMLLCTLTTACNKDDDPAPEPTPAELIVGKWYFVKQTSADGSVDGPKNECERKTYYEFREDGALNAASYALEDGHCEAGLQTAEYTLTADGKKILLSTEEEEDAVIEILTLDAQTLELANTTVDIVFLFEKR